MKFKLIFRVFNMNQFALVFILGPINTEISLLTVVFELRFILMPVKVAIFRKQGMGAFELLRGFLSISVGLLWKADDTSVDVRFSFFDELEDVSLDVLLVVER
jgi:hypothetical protein